MSVTRRGGSSVPHNSRALCIDSCGTPTSMHSMPSRVAVIGPMVVPHGMLLRVTNTWSGTPEDAATERMCAEPRAVVAYRMFPFSFSAGPLLTMGACRGS